MKAKLITKDGFYKMINVSKLSQIIVLPLNRKIIETTSPELNGSFITLYFTARFRFVKKEKKYALYNQIDSIVSLEQ